MASSTSGKAVAENVTHSEALEKSAGHHQWDIFPSIKTFEFFRTLNCSYLDIDLLSRSVINLFRQEKIRSGRGDFPACFHGEERLIFSASGIS